MPTQEEYKKLVQSIKSGKSEKQSAYSRMVRAVKNGGVEVSSFVPPHVREASYKAKANAEKETSAARAYETIALLDKQAEAIRNNIASAKSVNALGALPTNPEKLIEKNNSAVVSNVIPQKNYSPLIDKREYSVAEGEKKLKEIDDAKFAVNYNYVWDEETKQKALISRNAMETVNKNLPEAEAKYLAAKEKYGGPTTFSDAQNIFDFLNIAVSPNGDTSDTAKKQRAEMEGARKEYYEQKALKYIYSNGFFNADGSVDVKSAIKKLESEFDAYLNSNSSDNDVVEYNNHKSPIKTVLRWLETRNPNTTDAFMEQASGTIPDYYWTLKYMNEMYGAGNYVTDNLMVGLRQSTTGATGAVLDMTLGNILDLVGVEDKDNLFRNLNKGEQAAIQEHAEKGYKAAQLIGDENNIGGQFVFQTAGQLIPTLGLSFLGSAFGTAGTTASTATLQNTAALANSGAMGKLAINSANYLKGLANNPLYWNSFMTEAGSTYNEALASGMDNFGAALAALPIAGINAAIEVGGGVETAVSKITDNSFKTLLKEFISVPFEEAGEEILQGFVGRLGAKIIYDPTTKVADWKATFEEAIGGFIGGIMGGGVSLTFNQIAAASTNAQLSEIGKDVVKNSAISVEDLTEYGKQSLDTSIREVANKTKKTDADIGALYQYMLTDTHALFNNVNSLESANEALVSVLKQNNQTASANAIREYFLATEDYIAEAAALENVQQMQTMYNTSADSGNVDTVSENTAGVPNNGTSVLNNEAIGTDTEEAGSNESASSISQSENRAVFREKQGLDTIRPFTPDDFFRKDITMKQQQIEAVAKQLGLKVVWSREVSRGKYNSNTKTITINPDKGYAGMYGEIFGHEFTHFLESKKDYIGFKNYLFEKSTAFEEYLRERYLNENGTEFSGNREQLISATRNEIYELYKNSSELTAAEREAFTIEKAEREMVADFVGDVLLGSPDFDVTEQALTEMASTNRGWFQRFVDFIKDLIARLKPDKYNRTLTEDLEYLHDRLNRVYDSANKKTTAQDGGNSYSLAKNFDVEFQRAINNDEYYKNNVFVLGKMPSLYGNFGLDVSLDLTITVKHLKDSIMPKNPLKHQHGLSKTKIKNAVLQLANPAIVSYNENGILYVTVNETDSEIVPITFVIKPNGKVYIESHRKHSNHTMSLYGRDNTYNFIENKIANNRILLANKKETTELEKVLGKQFSDKLFKGGFNNSISKYRSIVNNNPQNTKKSTQTTEEHSLRKNSPIAAPADYAKKLLRRNHSKESVKTVESGLNEMVEHINSQDYGRAMNTSLNIAKGIIEASADTEILSDDALAILDEIRNTGINLSETQKTEVSHVFGSYNEYRKREMNRIKLRSEGVPLEAQWQEWAEEFPDIFKADTNAGDMAVELANIVENLKAQFVDFDTSAAAESLASQIFTEIISDKRTQEIFEISQNNSRAYNTYLQQISDYKKKLSQRDKKIARQKEQLAKSRAESIAELNQMRNERATKQKNIEYVRREVRRIDRKLRTNSDTNHIPENLKGAISDFIRVFVENDITPFDKKDLALVKLAYSELSGSEAETTETLLGSYDFDIDMQLGNLAKALDGKTLRELTNMELLVVRDIVDNFKFMISNENKMFLNGRKYDVAEIGNSALLDLRQKDSALDIKGKDFMVYNNMKPIYFFERLGGTFKKLYDDIFEGQNKWFRNYETSKTYIAEQREKYGYDNWDKTSKEFTTALGDKITLTAEQAMLLYATAKREQNNTLQGAEHLFIGGIVLDSDIKQSTAAKVKEIIKDKSKGVKDFFNEVDSKAHKISPYDVGMINEWLTDEQKAYADALVDYLSKDMAALGNEVSLKLFGIAKYNESYYIPYNSAQNFLYSQPGVTNEQRLKHQSFTKQTVRKANNPLVLSSLSDVVGDHINRMCMYNALTIPLENMNRVLNFKTAGSENLSPVSVKAEIERAHGGEALKYINQFLTDMNGNVRRSGTENMMGKMVSKAKKGAVLASASVVIQQTSAIMRAMAYINPKYFVATSLNLAERDYQQLIKYAPVAGIKEMGRFDTGVGVGNIEWLFKNEYKGLKKKAKGFFTDSTYRDDALGWAAGKADEITWAHIWAAVKAETKDKTNLRPGSEEFLEYAGKRFSEVIEYTQVYDSTLSRSQAMRDKSMAAQMLTSFMAEPTTSLNMLMHAAYKFKNGGKAGKAYAAKAVGAFTASVVVNALLKSLVTAGRDDSEEKTYLEKYIGEVTSNVASDIFIPNLIPFVKDIVSVFKGYDVERMDMTLFGDLAAAIKKIASDEELTPESIEKIFSSLAAFTGIPLRNIVRDFKTVKNMYSDFYGNIIEGDRTNATGIKYAVKDALGMDNSTTDIYAELAEAAEADDEERYQEIYGYLIDMGKDDAAINAGINKAFRESEKVTAETDKYIAEISKYDTYNSFLDDEKEKIKYNINSSLGIAAKVEAISTAQDLKNFDELYKLKSSNKKKYNKLREEMLEAGKTEKQIDEGLKAAENRYLESIGINPGIYYLYVAATSTANADKDGSGGVSKKEKKEAIDNTDLPEEIKKALWEILNKK